ncbi:MAG: hypothetical protein KDA61_00235, partial [Planctomycetales bacterium]|nr:hypothetical protein [Planctomycetales bacterium]
MHESSSRRHDIDVARAADALVEMLDAACGMMRVPFDRARMRRLLESRLEALGDNSSDGALPGSEALLDSAATCGLRMDLLTLDAEGAVAAFRPGAPVARWERDVDGSMRWLVIVDVRGSKVGYRMSEAGEVVHWASVSEFSAMCQRPAVATAWIGMEPLLACGSDASPHADGHSHSTPLR